MGVRMMERSVQAASLLLQEPSRRFAPAAQESLKAAEDERDAANAELGTACCVLCLPRGLLPCRHVC